MTKVDVIVIICIIILVITMYCIRKSKVTLIEPFDSDMKVMVYNDSKKRSSADLLSEIIVRMFKLRDQLIKEKDKYPEYKEYIELLEKNFNDSRTKIYENDPSSELTSFSVNKGEEVGFCLKSKKNGDLHKINLMIYVAIHEMGHMACPEIGHGELFKKIFRFLTLKAIDMKLYEKEDYSNNPVEYCGMILSSSIV
jgi:predicted metal-dependent hydrolase